MRASLVRLTGLRPVFPVLMPVFSGIGPVKNGLDVWQFVLLNPLSISIFAVFADRKYCREKPDENDRQEHSARR